MGLFKKIFSANKNDNNDKSGEESLENSEEKNYQKSLESGLKRSKNSFYEKIKLFVAGKTKIDDEFLDELEIALISSDVGVETTLKIIDKVKKRAEKDKYQDSEELNIILREEIISLLEENKYDAKNTIKVQKQGLNPFVILVVGVNGVGKTTTIGKLAAKFKNEGKKVVLGAADTFRAAAIEQLEVWAGRTQSDIIKKEMGADPSSVAFEAVSYAQKIGADVVIIDTAGRLHNKINLMNELAKVRRVIEKQIPEAPHQVILVLDGSTGQNAYQQAKQFAMATDITALAITKLDGSAKGGVVIGICDQMKIPVKYIGVGEKVEDLQDFDSKVFVETFFN